MLKIRLARVGKKGQPSYRIVVTETRSKRDSHYLKIIGFYNPLTHPATIKVDPVAYKHWLTQGAQPSVTVRALVKKAASL